MREKLEQIENAMDELQKVGINELPDSIHEVLMDSLLMMMSAHMMLRDYIESEENEE